MTNQAVTGRRVRQMFLMVSVMLLLTACHLIPDHQPKLSAHTPTQRDRTMIVVPPDQTNAGSMTAPLPSVTLPSGASPSLMPLVLTGDVTPLHDLIVASIPTSLNDAANPLGSKFRWSFTLNGEPLVIIQNGNVVIRAEYVGWIEAKVASSRPCRLDPVYPVMEEVAHLDVKQVAGRLTIRMDNPRMKVWLKPDSDSRCQSLTPPLQEQLRTLVQADATHARIARAVERANMEIHTDVASNFSIQSLHSQFCLYPSASDITVDTVDGRQGQIVFRTMAHVSVIATADTSCPTLALAPSMPDSAAVAHAPSPLTIASEVALAHNVLSEIMEAKLRSTVMEMSDYGGKTLVQKVTATDAAGKVLIAVEISGYLRGTLYFWGIPQLEHWKNGGSVLTIPDLRLDPESKRILEEIRPDLGHIVDDKLGWMVREAAKIDLGERLDKIQSVVIGPHQAGDITVNVTAVRLRPETVSSTPQGLVTDVRMDATAYAVGRFNLRG